MDVDNFYRQNIDRFKQGETIREPHLLPGGTVGQRP
jgi:hypothetical protein